MFISAYYKKKRGEKMSKKYDLVGLKFGKLTVKSKVQNLNSKKKRVCWGCVCDCGNTVVRPTEKIIKAMKDGVDSSCGCGRRDLVIKRCGRNIDGQRFGRLVVLETIWKSSVYDKPMVRCKCDCGAEVVLAKNDVQSLHTQSCGCLQKDRTSVARLRDWTGFISDSGVELLHETTQNEKGQRLWEARCFCGKYFEVLPTHIANNHIHSCGCISGSSGEKMIESILESHKIQFQKQYTFSDCVDKQRLKFDFAIIKNGQVDCLIEYDGKQHYEPIEYFGGIQEYQDRVRKDNIKDEYCKKNHIPLYRFTYAESKNDIENKIINIVNRNDCGAFVVT